MGKHTHLKCIITRTHTHTHKKYIITHTHTHTRVVFLSTLGLVFGYEPSFGLLHHVVKTSTVTAVNRDFPQQSEMSQAQSAHCHPPLWPLESRGITRTRVFVFWRNFLLSQERKELGRGGDPYGNREQKQKHTETAPVSQCFRNTFPKHLRENPTL